MFLVGVNAFLYNQITNVVHIAQTPFKIINNTLVIYNIWLVFAVFELTFDLTINKQRNNLGGVTNFEAQISRLRTRSTLADF